MMLKISSHQHCAYPINRMILLVTVLCRNLSSHYLWYGPSM